jgi:ABC-type sugar transport system permease subunit
MGEVTASERSARGDRAVDKRLRKIAGTVSPYLYLVPALLFVVIFLLYPIFFTIYLSFTDWDLVATTPKFVGLKQYIVLFTSPVFWNSLRNTLLWTASILFVAVPLSLLFAVGTENIAGREAFKFTFFLPRVIAPAAIGVIWRLIYAAPHGILNDFLDFVGLPALKHAWVMEIPLNTFAMITTSIWANIGWMMVMFLIGLDTIPSEVQEAARIDGASGFKLLRHITLPLLRPMTAVVVVMGVVVSFTIFDIIWVINKGGPYRSSENLAATMFYGGFVSFKMGYSAAIAVVLSVVVLIFSVLYMRSIFSRRE